MNTISEKFNLFWKKCKNQFHNYKRVTVLIWRASSFYTTIWIFLLILQGILPGLMVLFTKYAVDSLVAAINGGGAWENIEPTVIWIAAIGGVMLTIEIAKSILEFVRSAQSDIIQDYVKNLIHQKASEVDLEHYESHEYHDRLEQATTDGSSRPLSLLENIGSLIQNTITILVMAGLLIQYSFGLPFVLLISTFPAFIIILRFDRKYHKWWKESTSKRRWIQYFDIMLTHRLAFTEMKVFNLNPHFQKSYQDLRSELRTEKLDQIKKLGIAKLFASMLSLLILSIVLMWMGWRAFHGLLTLGDLALFYQAFNHGQGLMRSMLANLGSIIKDSLFLEVLFEFLDLKSNMADPENPKPLPKNLYEGIRLSNVHFRYPEADRDVFSDLSMFIPAGKTIAIVGENGSGKTTLLKLICRFYDPQKGSIEFDGIDIRNFRHKELLRYVTITFQTPLNYHATIKESIAMGDLEKPASTAEIVKSAQDAGAHDFISRFPDGYDTLLGKVYVKGTELSGGEWQRLALARAYYRKAPVVLLDEPTSFMDSWSEGDWFRRFRSFVKNRTSVVITHRFTIAMRADLIFVMDKGKIIETGTHHQLLEMDGFYAKSWKEQMRASGEFKTHTAEQVF